MTTENGLIITPVTGGETRSYVTNPNEWMGNVHAETDPVTGGIRFNYTGDGYPSSITKTSRDIVLFGDSLTEMNKDIGNTAHSNLTQSGGTATLSSLTSQHAQKVRIYRVDPATDYWGDHTVTTTGGVAKFPVSSSTPATSSGITPTHTYTSLNYMLPHRDTDQGWMTWANIRLKNAFNVVNVSAIGGQTTTDMLGLIYDPYLGVIPFNPTWCSVFGGINDATINETAGMDWLVSAESIISNLSDIYLILRNHGINIFAVTLMPLESGHSHFGNADVEKVILYVNQWIRRTATTTPGMYLWDFFSVVVDPTTAFNGSLTARANYLASSDHIHFSAIGARAVGDYIYGMVASTWPPQTTLVASNLDAITNTHLGSSPNVIKQVVSNPLMSGTTGTTTGSTGTWTLTDNPPSSWNVAIAGATSAATLTTPARTVSHDGDDVGDNIKVVMTAGAASDTLVFRSSPTGSWFEAGGEYVAEIDVKLTNMSGVKAYYLMASMSIDGVSTAAYCLQSKTPTQFPQTDFSGVFRTTETLKIPSGSPSITSAFLYFTVDFGSAGGATVEVGRASWRRVN